MSLIGNPFNVQQTQNVNKTPGPGPSPVDLTPQDQEGLLNPDELNADGTPKAKGGDPLMQFDKLWEDAPIDPNNPIVEESSSYLPKIDPAQLNATIGKLDFTKNIKPELMQAITEGGASAAAALPEILNTVLRQAIHTSFSTNSRMMEAGLSTARERFTRDISPTVKSTMLENSLQSSNKLMSDPAYAPQVESVRNRYQAKFPKATPQQIETAVNGYFDNMLKKMTAKDIPTADDAATANLKDIKTGSANADWQNWFEPKTA